MAAAVPPLQRSVTMARKTNFIVYVHKDVLDDPVALFDAAFKHLQKKNVDVAERRRFTADFMRAERKGAGKDDLLDVIDQWVQVRDVESFPLANKPEDAVADDNKSD